MNIRRFLSLAILASSLLTSYVAADAKTKSPDRDKLTVVLDPGHGGKDFGAVENGAKEKDINLAVAKKLRDLIEKELSDDVDVVMTRTSDVYLTLQQRADVANNADGDLFMSIHVNSVDKKNPKRKSTQGSSVYVLGLHRDQDNMKVAMRENAVIELESDYKEKYSGFDPSKDESYIIFEMAQKRNLGESIRIAGDAQNELVKNAGRANRGVRQAGFWVLWATSMPAVLVELDFICNPDAVKFMTSSQGEDKLAASLFNSIKKFVERRK
ncbi:MAG: N-acetylmuramoyl-L-alanine amidase [Bacteroides sp.]|nr:N-acetylmuramoyl-L-alanine amidase [Bacteroides sp.]